MKESLIANLWLLSCRESVELQVENYVGLGRLAREAAESPTLELFKTYADVALGDMV